MDDENFIASFVDEIPTKYVSQCIDLQFQDIQQEVLANPRLSPIDFAGFAREVNNFQLNYKELIGIENGRLKNAALRAVASALRLSYYYAGGPETAREFRLNQTASARERRNRIGRGFQEVVEKEARKLWARSPRYLNNARGTARNIYATVAAAIDSLPNPPKWWNPRSATIILGSEALDNTTQSLRGESNDQTKTRRIEAIRKQISRIGRREG